MVANAFLVDPNMRTVVSRANVEEGAGARFRLRIKIPLVPENTLVIEELRNLRVPIARNLERSGAVEKSYSSLCLPTDIGLGVHGI